MEETTTGPAWLLAQRLTGEEYLRTVIANGLVDAWELHTSDLTDLACETCAKEWAEDLGLVRDPLGVGYVSAVGGDASAWPIWHPGAIESDYPHSCSGCGLLLDHTLTNDGADYVRDNYPAIAWHLWGVDDAK